MVNTRRMASSSETRGGLDEHDEQMVNGRSFPISSEHLRGTQKSHDNYFMLQIPPGEIIVLFCFSFCPYRPSPPTYMHVTIRTHAFSQNKHGNS